MPPLLPGRFGDARNFTVGRKFTNTDAAGAEEPDVPVAASAQLAAVVDARWECSLFPFSFPLQECAEVLLLPVDEGGSGHRSRLRLRLRG